MKGLLRKELYCIWRCCRPVLLIVLVFTLISPWSRGNVMILLYPLLFAGLLPMTLLSYDERDHWESFTCGLPLSRAALVSSKYLMALGMELTALLPLLLVQILVERLGPQDILDLLGLALLLGLLPSAILLPVIFRFGVSKGRLVYYVIIGLFCSLCFTVIGEWDRGFVPQLPFGSSLLPFLLPPLAFGLSWLLSIHFYQKRDL